MLETTVDNRTPYRLGQDLFGNGSLAPMPTDSLKRQIREKLRAKHSGFIYSHEQHKL